MVPRSGGMLPSGARVPLPSWLSEADLDIYAGKFARSGFRGPLNYYRNVDRNWELMRLSKELRSRCLHCMLPAIMTWLSRFPEQPSTSPI